MEISQTEVKGDPCKVEKVHNYTQSIETIEKQRVSHHGALWVHSTS